MTDLGTLGGTEAFPASVAFGINNRDQVVGDSETTGNSAVHAFLWQDGTMTDLGTLGGTYSFASGINDRGQVVGYASPPGDTALHAFLWQKGTMTDLGTLGGDTFSAATGINDGGQVVGYGTTHAFLWQHGTMTDLGTLGGTYSLASAINASGTVIGESTLPGDTAQDPFIYSKGTMTDLYTLLPAGAVTYLTVNGINDRGQIVGWGIDSNGYIGALLLTPSDNDHSDTAGAPSRHGDAMPAIIATLGASQDATHQIQIASFGQSKVLAVSAPSPAKEVTSSAQVTVHFGTPRNDGLHHFAATHGPASSAPAWEVIDRVFADFDN
jgi:probable HAF family extracellular repeat protein